MAEFKEELSFARKSLSDSDLRVLEQRVVGASVRTGTVND